MSEMVRTAAIIAAEINIIKEQTMKTVYTASVEIGRRLLEAKSLVDHGHWGEWLKDNVDYSQSTANNLMKICLEYDENQQNLFESPKSQTFGNLNYSQLVALLSLPAPEREEFVHENNVEDMSVRELNQAIKERDEARAEKERLEEESRSAAEKLSDYKAQAAANKAEAQQHKQDKANAEQQLKKQITDLKDALKKVDERTPKQVDISEETAAKYEAEIAQLKADIETAHKAKEENEDYKDNEQEELIDEYKERIENLEREKAEIERKASIGGNTDIQKLMALFEMFQENYNKMYALLERIQSAGGELAETGTKIRTGLESVLDGMRERL